MLFTASSYPIVVLHRIDCFKDSHSVCLLGPTSMLQPPKHLFAQSPHMQKPNGLKNVRLEWNHVDVGREREYVNMLYWIAALCSWLLAFMRGSPDRSSSTFAAVARLAARCGATLVRSARRQRCRGGRGDRGLRRVQRQHGGARGILDGAARAFGRGAEGRAARAGEALGRAGGRHWATGT